MFHDPYKINIFKWITHNGRYVSWKVTTWFVDDPLDNHVKIDLAYLHAQSKTLRKNEIEKHFLEERTNKRNKTEKINVSNMLWERRSTQNRRIIWILTFRPGIMPHKRENYGRIRTRFFFGVSAWFYCYYSSLSLCSQKSFSVGGSNWQSIFTFSQKFPLNSRILVPFTDSDRAQYWSYDLCLFTFVALLSSTFLVSLWNTIFSAELCISCENVSLSQPLSWDSDMDHSTKQD